VNTFCDVLETTEVGRPIYLLHLTVVMVMATHAHGKVPFSQAMFLGGANFMPTEVGIIPCATHPLTMLR